MTHSGRSLFAVEYLMLHLVIVPSKKSEPKDAILFGRDKCAIQNRLSKNSRDG